MSVAAEMSISGVSTLNTAGISAIVTACHREEMTCRTINRLKSCMPAPGEILVHFDHGASFPVPAGVRVLQSFENIGPGGARNLLIRAATHEWIASFDDDSYPEDPNFFGKVSESTTRHPEAGILACSIRHRDPRHDSLSGDGDREVSSFVGCGCVYRKTAFLQTAGYLPLPVAYGMEEVDLALQMHDLNLSVIECPELKVFHDTHLAHHQSARITSGAVKNQALLVWIRYPWFAFPLGFLQWLNKIRDSIFRKRIIGSVRGVLETPLHLWHYRHHRRPVTWQTLMSSRKKARRTSQ
jgi:GT2 family glycosyltransferase